MFVPASLAFPYHLKFERWRLHLARFAAQLMLPSVAIANEDVAPFWLVEWNTGWYKAMSHLCLTAWPMSAFQPKSLSSPFLGPPKSGIDGAPPTAGEIKAPWLLFPAPPVKHPTCCSCFLRRFGWTFNLQSSPLQLCILDLRL